MMSAWLCRLRMRSTSLSVPGAGSRSHVRWMYAVWSRFYDPSIALDPAFRRGAAAMVTATVRDGDRVLDVGIGTGLLAEVGAVRAAQGVGLDYSMSLLDRARGKLVCNPRLDGRTVRYDLRKPFDVISKMRRDEEWRPQRDLNSCYWRERPESWAGLDDGDGMVLTRTCFLVRSGPLGKC